jgi:hypothetical protein
VQAEWPWIHQTLAICPDQQITGPTIVSSIILHLNDEAKWSREAIAAWVATVEPPDPSPQPDGDPRPLDDAIPVPPAA